ncbi:Rrf2 family transcriptional regulator [Alkalibacter rhizosphaerae]|uniref:Rrf2 family transcriptional regulator n=1 Tax=Alkalibacter rhizosphaerae TaxID=2815577 RepID=A0A974XMV9_9FIRM|nr:Rrf2 family transcriptional regulator [Alkalibacter rhizosphaerae]QSX08806.1 Rrf2 family transcriptional regulator [Alkalibacter rhizosphaerae]
MRLSTKGRYGVMAMLQLAMHYDQGTTSLKDIARQMDYSDAYLEQLFALLKKERLITSHRGPKGGYRLSKEPHGITVGEIIRALEGPIEFSTCVGGSESVPCDRSPHCVTKDLWEQINDSINSVIDHVTLGDLMDKNKNFKQQGKRS